MSDALPVVWSDDDQPFIPDPASGELLPVAAHADETLLLVAEQAAQVDRRILTLKRAVAHELRDRHGVGVARSAGFRFQVAEPTNWPKGATWIALQTLVESGAIGRADAERCMPSKPTPDGRQLKALLGRLVTADAEAARVLQQACTTSPPSLRDVEREAIQGSVEEQA